ncbi:MAG: hypothetical protein EZS28_008506, partial [Streblomastix strix]
MSLAALLKEHQTVRAQKRDLIEQNKKNAVRCANQLGDELAEVVNKELTVIFQNQKQLDAETKRLQQNAARFLRQSSSWLALAGQLTDAFKELGDVGNFVEMIAGEMKTVADA